MNKQQEKRINHEKVTFLLVFINGLIFSQMRPGIDYMPQIAFFDFMVNSMKKQIKLLVRMLSFMIFVMAVGFSQKGI